MRARMSTRACTHAHTHRQHGSRKHGEGPGRSKKLAPEPASQFQKALVHGHVGVDAYACIRMQTQNNDTHERKHAHLHAHTGSTRAHRWDAGAHHRPAWSRRMLPKQGDEAKNPEKSGQAAQSMHTCTRTQHTACKAKRQSKDTHNQHARNTQACTHKNEQASKQACMQACMTKSKHASRHAGKNDKNARTSWTVITLTMSNERAPRRASGNTGQ